MLSVYIRYMSAANVTKISWQHSVFFVMYFLRSKGKKVKNNKYDPRSDLQSAFYDLRNRPISVVLISRW